MHAQSLLTFSVALLAGTSFAAEYNGGEIPAVLRKERTKVHGSDLPFGSSSAAGVGSAIPTPSNFRGFSSAALPSSGSFGRTPSFSLPSSAPTPSFSVPVPSSAATPGFAFPSSSFLVKPSTSAKPSASVRPSSAHGFAPQGTHGAQQAASSGKATSAANLPVSEIASSTAKDGSKKPFWNKPIANTQGPPSPNTPDFSVTPNENINSKDGCAVRCSDLANQCAELLPHNQDFW